MNTVFVLLILIIPPDSELRIAFDKERFVTLQECLDRSESRANMLKGKVLWTTSNCVAVPKNSEEIGS